MTGWGALVGVGRSFFDRGRLLSDDSSEPGGAA
jgi:hypothetical protein